MEDLVDKINWMSGKNYYSKNDKMLNNIHKKNAKYIFPKKEIEKTYNNFPLIKEIIKNNNLIDRYLEKSNEEKRQTSLYHFVYNHELLYDTIQNFTYNGFGGSLISYLLFNYLLQLFVMHPDVEIEEYYSSYINFCVRNEITYDLYDISEFKNDNCLYQTVNLCEFLKRNNFYNTSENSSLLMACVNFIITKGNCYGRSGGGLISYDISRMDSIRKIFNIKILRRNQKFKPTGSERRRSVRKIRTPMSDIVDETIRRIRK